MSHTKSKDTRSDCICRYKAENGRMLCNNRIYPISMESLIYHDPKYFDPNDVPTGPEDRNWQNGGGFYLPDENPMNYCRSCKYYCNNAEQYKAMRTAFIQKMKELKK